MARLPQPGYDTGTWGNLLNDYLAQSHNNDGTLKDGSVTGDTIAAGSLSKSDVGLSDVDNTADADKPISTATQTVLNTKLTASNNLSDLPSTPTARTNLGLGTSATLNVGTGTGTVAAGDDSRITGAAPLASPTFTGTVTVPLSTTASSPARYSQLPKYPDATVAATVPRQQEFDVRDYATFELAVTAAAGGRLYVPAGSYSTAQNVLSTADTEIYLARGATVTLATGTNSSVFNITAPRCTIRGPGVIDGNKANQTTGGVTPSGASIRAQGGADDLTIEDITIVNSKSSGIWIQNVDRARIERVKTSATDYIGIFAEASTRACVGVRIKNCEVDRSTISAASIVQGGLKVKGTATFLYTGVQVVDNDVTLPISPTDGTAVCIEPTNAPRARVRGNRTEGGTMGVSLALCDNGAVVANDIYNASTYGIENASSPRAVISTNTVYGAALTSTGIGLTGASVFATGTSITGNTVEGCTGNALLALSATNLTISGNTLRHPASYVVNLIRADYSTITGNTIDGQGTAQKGVMLDTCSRMAVVGNTIKSTTESGVLSYSAVSAYVIQLVSITGNIFESVNVAYTTLVSGGASVATTIKTWGNHGPSDTLELSTAVSVRTGTAAPEGSVNAGAGAIYLRQSGTQGQLYCKGGTVAVNTGWKEVAREDAAVAGKLLTTAGIGVGNSAAATTPGTITKKIQIFDATGTSLGYVPVYDAIT